jgi:glyoxylase-like metal-dependent hydrolase (beta-lactamase superfamily II)
LALHLVCDGRRAVLIDTGVAASLNVVRSLIDAAGLAATDVELIVNTHAHHDHIGSNRHVKEQTGALLAAPAGAVAWIEDHQRHLREFTAHHPDLLQLSAEEGAALAATLDGPTRVDLVVREGVRVRLGPQLELLTLELPGHIDAEVGFVEPASRTLLLADAIPRVDWPLFHGHGRPAVLRSTLRRLRGIVAAERIERACMAHYAVMTTAELLATIDAAEEFVEQVDAQVRGAVRDAAPDAIALGDVWESVCAWFAREREFRGLAMVAAHLAELVDTGVIERCGPERYRWIDDLEEAR